MSSAVLAPSVRAKIKMLSRNALFMYLCMHVECTVSRKTGTLNLDDMERSCGRNFAFSLASCWRIARANYRMSKLFVFLCCLELCRLK